MAIGVGKLGSILKRIDRRLKKVELSDRSASLAAGLSADLIRTLRRQYKEGKQHGISENSLARLARVLKTNPNWLLTGVGPEEGLETPFGKIAAAAGGLHVVGTIEAGTWVEIVDSNFEEPAGEVFIPADPRYPIEQQYAVEVSGTSVDGIAREGEYLIVVDIGPKAGDLVIVVRTYEGKREVTAKRYYRNSTHIELRYDSTNPRFTDPTHKDYQPPVRFKPGQPAEDGTEVEIRGVVVAVHRKLIVPDSLQLDP